MNPSSLIGHVIQALDAVLASPRPADTVIGQFFRSRRYLGASDRRFIAERAYDVLRNARRLSAACLPALAAMGRTPAAREIPAVILVAASEAAASDEEPETIAARIGPHWTEREIACARFLEELRAAARAGPPCPLAIRYSLPDFVAEEWSRRYGPGEAEELARASNGAPPVAIRVNLLKGGVRLCAEALAREGIPASPGGISPAGLILSRRINVQSLSSFRRGLFEMQDEGSQLISLLLEARPGMAVLDACAGAGGKSLHLAAIMRDRGKIVALDTDGKKIRNLRVRMRRAGATIVHPAVARDERGPELAGQFDAVLVDAPCSGTGTFRRNPWAKLRCTEEGSRSHAVRQRELLERYAAAVRGGGRLVYSTCTLLRRENQDVAESFLAAHTDFSPLNADEVLSRQGIRRVAEGPWMELLPHRSGTDGFFAAVMVRV